MGKRVIVTGTGNVASSVVRALAPAGYNVTTLGIEEKGVKVFKKLAYDWTDSADRVEKVLKGYEKINPFLDLEEFVCEVPHVQVDLSEAERLRQELFDCADYAIFTAANPDSKQNEDSAARNYKIDRNCIDAAIKSGVKKIILTSSLWRTAEAVGSNRLIDAEKDEAASFDVPYAKAKLESVRYLKKMAEENKDRIFSYLDLGWHPRQTRGQPISNLGARLTQWWIAECELQQHYLLMLDLEKSPYFGRRIAAGENCFGFNGFSRNEPPKELKHPAFAYDLSNSRRLGVRHEFNVYETLKSKSGSWRRIPVVDD